MNVVSKRSGSRLYTLRNKIKNVPYRNDLLIKVVSFWMVEDGEGFQYCCGFENFCTLQKFLSEAKKDNIKVKVLDIVDAYVDSKQYYNDDDFFKMDFLAIIEKMVQLNFE